MSVKHTIRSSNGGTVTVRLTPLTAITKCCRECMGFVFAEVERCTSPLCPLFPFRNGEGHSGKSKKGSGKPFTTLETTNEGQDVSRQG